jgi:hypothetical protein
MSHPAQLPPQSTAVSVPSRTPFAQGSHSSTVPSQSSSTPLASQFSTAAGLMATFASLQSVPGVAPQPAGTQRYAEQTPVGVGDG